MALPVINHPFRLIEPPELRFSASGTPVLRVRLAANSSKKDDQGNWVNADQLFLNATAFGPLAEAVAEANLSKGQEVLASGQLRTNSWENQQGEKRSTIEMRLFAMGPTIRPARNGGGGGAQRQAPGEDPWAAPAGGGGAAQGEEPPF